MWGAVVRVIRIAQCRLVSTNMSLLSNTTQFLKEARIELKKVTWPTRQETIRATVAIIVVSTAMAIFLGGLDYLFKYILNTFVL